MPDIITLFYVCRETVADQLSVVTVTTITFRWESPRGAPPDAAPASRLCTPTPLTSSTGSARTVADASKFVQWKSMNPQINVQFYQTSFQFYSLKRKSECKKEKESVSENQPKLLPILGRIRLARHVKLWKMKPGKMIFLTRGNIDEYSTSGIVSLIWKFELCTHFVYFTDCRGFTTVWWENKTLFYSWSCYFIIKNYVNWKVQNFPLMDPPKCFKTFILPRLLFKC